MSKSFDQGKDEVAKLCQYFATNQQSYRAPGVKEAHVRQSLIDPFFEALGWDVRNASMTAPQYREVIPEDSVDVEGQQKAPDYTFRIGTLPKFYVEAKKCGVNINTDTGPAYQLRRYGFSAKLALSILTDFEELGVYDCSSRPQPSNKASHARTLYFGYSEYPDRWKEIWDVFSREAVWSGAFDQYTASKRKRGTSEVDSEFLKDIEGWRDVLARNLALRNLDLSADDLNAAVQLIIDRIIFLRMAEDRRLEPDGQLLKLCERPQIYTRFISDVCRKADEKYNSGLFHFQKESGISDTPDTLTPRLSVDDNALKPILQSLYFEHGCPYQFGVMPVEILGTVYERFLGKVIRLTAGHQAKVEEKPEVRKAGGVYYTPSYIVDYIVLNTIGKQIDGKSPVMLAGSKTTPPFRVLDMACGSGSFLLGAYQFLLDHCLKWYQSNPSQKNTKAIYQNAKGEIRLSINERKRILTTHIFGVDIDRQAVETTKLSLLLKALEGENDSTLSQQMTLFHERALPNLSDNIKCGNSLISSDYSMVPEDLVRVNAFDWPSQFPDAMKAGGFDAVIGNPPYLKIEHINESDRNYFFHAFKSCVKRYDAYGLFVEKSLSLLATGARFGMIIPSTMLNNLSFRELRKLLLNSSSIETIVNLGGKVFESVNNDTLILIFTCGRSDGFKTQIYDVPHYGSHLSSAQLIGSKDLSKASSEQGYAFELRVSESIDAVFDKMRLGNQTMGDICSIFQGFVTGGNEAYIVDHETIQNQHFETAICKSAVFGDGVSRYGIPQAESFVIYLTKDHKLKDYPNIEKRLEPYKSQLQKKREVQLGRQPWYSLHWPRVQTNFERSPKLLVQAIRNLSLKKRIVASLDSEGLFADHTLNVIYTTQTKYDLKYILGILNSSLMNFVFSKKYVDINIKGIYLADIPIRRIDSADLTDKLRHDHLVELVEKMLALTPKLRNANSESEKSAFKNAITTTDIEIDRLVYELYGLTEEEIKIVEG